MFSSGRTRLSAFMKKMCIVGVLAVGPGCGLQGGAPHFHENAGEWAAVLMGDLALDRPGLRPRGRAHEYGEKKKDERETRRSHDTPPGWFRIHPAVRV